MRSQQFHTRWLIATVTAAVVAVMVVPTAAAKPTSGAEIAPDGWAVRYASPSETNAWAYQIEDPYGTLALQESGVIGEEFVPGVTDSTTGVLRELERKGLEPRPIPSTASVEDSGFQWDDAAIGMGAVLAAAILMAASAALVGGERRRRRPAI